MREHVLLAMQVVIAGVGALCIASNWWGVFVGRSDGRTSSPIPIIGGLTAAAGLYINPATRSYAWLPVLLDFYYLAILYMLVLDTPYKAWRMRRANMLCEYVAPGPDGARLRLFKDNLFDLTAPHVSINGTWREDGGILILESCGETASLKREAHVLTGQIGFASLEKLQSLQLPGMQLARQGEK